MESLHPPPLRLTASWPKAKGFHLPCLAWQFREYGWASSMVYLGFIQNLQMPELVIIFIAVLLIFGPKNLPKLGRSLGHMTREFKDATNKITESISDLDREPRRPSPPRTAINSTPSTPSTGNTEETSANSPEKMP